jgi:hypothetical protein
VVKLHAGASATLRGAAQVSRVAKHFA